MGFFKNKEEKEHFLQGSKYYKSVFLFKKKKASKYKNNILKRNQKIAGVHLREFLTIFQQVLEKARKTDPSLKEYEFLNRFLKEMDANLTFVLKLFSLEIFNYFLQKDEKMGNRNRK